MKTKGVSVWYALVVAGCWMSAEIVPADVATGQEPTFSQREPEGAHESDRVRRLADMRRLADTVEVMAGDGEKSAKAKLIPKPLYRFSDQKRFISDGTVWAWGTAGRPVVMAEFHTGDRLQPVWGQWLVATSDVPVAAVIGGHGRWATRETDFKLYPILNIGVPAESEAGRLRQMKRFAQSLRASSVWKEQRFELRLLTTEVYRYSDAQSGLIDGAVFVFAVDSNPEAILFVEAHGDEANTDAPRSWKYALAQMSAASLTFSRGDTEVWAAPQSYGGPNAPHYAFTRQVPNRTGDLDQQ
jgi:hypothetical protein